MLDNAVRESRVDAVRPQGQEPSIADDKSRVNAQLGRDSPGSQNCSQ
jgi:hypothetical protein